MREHPADACDDGPAPGNGHWHVWHRRPRCSAPTPRSAPPQAERPSFDSMAPAHRVVVLVDAICRFAHTLKFVITRWTRDFWLWALV